ncbi:MAG: YsnF/AvaK domain-containing protein [bacterium]|nr:YsnF/AvaK domain-containing protein [bacterium]
MNDPSMLTDPLGLQPGEQHILPVIVESAEVHKRRMVRGRVRLRKSVYVESVRVDEPGYAERVEVERVPINQYVETAPMVRHEGDTMIIPVVQEVVVVERRLMLREEVRVTRHRVETRSPQTIELRREAISVERSRTSDSDA